MLKLGKEKDSVEYWENVGNAYTSALVGDYHGHRLSVIDALIPQSLYQPGNVIFDFGCGNAVHFEQFLKSGAIITGIDISDVMISLAHQNLLANKRDTSLAQLANVNAMKDIPAASQDAVLSFNVLAYLNNDEEKTFYQETQRILKPGGQLIVTHSNELFDMFSLNRYTAEFFKKNFLKSGDGIEKLLTNANLPEKYETYNVRENPLSYKHKLAAYGLSEIQQEFINKHNAPPAMLNGKDYPDTLNFGAADKWKLMFSCSTYGSRSVKIAAV